MNALPALATFAIAIASAFYLVAFSVYSIGMG
jgi:hypothetical protein